MTTRTLALTIVALSLAGAAGAQEPAKPQLELVLETKRAEVPVGDVIKTTVRLKNLGKDPVELPELAEDRQLVSFDVQLDAGKVFPCERIHPSPTKPRLDWPVKELAPGKSWELEVSFPALAKGVFTITPIYGRQPDSRLKTKPPKTVGKPVKVSIVAAKNGGTELGVQLRTTYGPIRLRLFPREALGTCLNFARLVLEGGRPYSGDPRKPRPKAPPEVRKPFYRGITFHRVIKTFMIQGGCPFGTGEGDAGFGITNEAPKKDGNKPLPERARHTKGRLSMAMSAHPDSGGTQFFIVTGQARHLDGKHTVFGEVIRGTDVVYTIAEVPTRSVGDQRNKPFDDVVIEHIGLRPIKK